MARETLLTNTNTLVVKVHLTCSTCESPASRDVFNHYFHLSTLQFCDDVANMLECYGLFHKEITRVMLVYSVCVH